MAVGAPPAASFRDPIHGFIHADPLELALVASRPVQRLRWVHQLAFAYMVFPGAEHSRFSHVLGAMHLAGRIYDALAARSGGLLDPDPAAEPRRLVRVAALLHDIGHPPFSHSAEELFEEAIDHEEMTRRLLGLDELARIFERQGNGITAEKVARLLAGADDPSGRVLSQIISGELDVDKMDYLLRDSLYCGVRYGHFDLDRLVETIMPIEDPDSGDCGIGVEEGGVHALEALVMARYYMFTQVYFNLTGKVLELHFTEWLSETGRRWPAAPEAFLTHDDVSMLSEMRGSANRHARAIVHREHFPLAFESREHLSRAERDWVESKMPELLERFGAERLLISHSAKDPHRLGTSRVLVRMDTGELLPMEEASQFIRHLSRIDRYRVYCLPEIREEVADVVAGLMAAGPSAGP